MNTHSTEKYSLANTISFQIVMVAQAIILYQNLHSTTAMTARSTTDSLSVTSQPPPPQQYQSTGIRQIPVFVIHPSPVLQNNHTLQRLDYVSRYHCLDGTIATRQCFKGGRFELVRGHQYRQPKERKVWLVTNRNTRLLPKLDRHLHSTTTSYNHVRQRP